MNLHRVALLTNITTLVSSWIWSSQIWASAIVSESQTEVSITGLAAYPQVSFLLLTGVLILWLSKYMNSVFSKFITTAVIVLLVSAASPVWFESASGSLSILSPEIAKVTGVSDWLGQTELIISSFYNHVAADFFVIALILWFATLVIFIWSNKPGQVKKQFVTRIDNLPSW